MNVYIEFAIEAFMIGSFIGFTLAMLGPLLEILSEWMKGDGHS